MTIAIRRDIERIARQFDEFKELSKEADRKSDRVSRWSVGQHIYHLTKSDRSIFGFFGEPEEGPHKRVTALGRIVLWSGWIPRGRGKAPKATRPDAEPQAPNAEELAGEIEAVDSLFAASLEPREALLEPAAIAKHPYFGGLNRAQWLRFVAVHHRHHAKIIRDVLRTRQT